MKKFLDIWKYSLGSFSDEKTQPYDNYVAGVRTIILVSYLVTNCFIVAGVIRHWNNQPEKENGNVRYNQVLVRSRAGFY